MTTRPIEIELALVILSDHLDREIEILAGLSRAGEYDLAYPIGETMHDQYFDTPEELLGRNKISLRIRHQNGKVLIALKGPSEADVLRSPARRFEIEQLWSWEALVEIASSLEELGISFLLSSESFDTKSPEVVLGELGLSSVQERETLRLAKDVRAKGKSSKSILAQLAIDSTTYKYGWAEDVRHHEVEIEATSTRSEEPIQAIAAAIVKASGGLLELWPHSKYATGKAIADLLRDGTLDDLLDEDRSLTRPAYSLLDKHIGEQEL